MLTPDWASSSSPSSDISMGAARLPAGVGSCGKNMGESGCEGSGLSGINTGSSGSQVRLITGGDEAFTVVASVIRQLLSDGEGGSFVSYPWPSSPKSGKNLVPLAPPLAAAATVGGPRAALLPSSTL